MVFHDLLGSMINNIIEEYLKKHQANQNLLNILSMMRSSVMVMDFNKETGQYQVSHANKAAKEILNFQTT